MHRSGEMILDAGQTILSLYPYPLWLGDFEIIARRPSESVVIPTPNEQQHRAAKIPSLLSLARGF
ncbi:MAG: hypothetical protein EBZ48_12965 [Proteobacteria bacterium]|nr:hypothetical protein [Pseudomonadota bacterium]